MATYANYTAIFPPGNDSVKTVNFLKTHLNLIDEWLSNWRIQINLDKSICILFILKFYTPFFLLPRNINPNILSG